MTLHWAYITYYLSLILLYTYIIIKRDAPGKGTILNADLPDLSADPQTDVVQFIVSIRQTFRLFAHKSESEKGTSWAAGRAFESHLWTFFAGFIRSLALGPDSDDVIYSLSVRYNDTKNIRCYSILGVQYRLQTLKVALFSEHAYRFALYILKAFALWLSEAWKLWNSEDSENCNIYGLQIVKTIILCIAQHTVEGAFLL
jgi:hypothetical protein